MPEKINVEVIMGKPGRREGEGGKDFAAPPKRAEAEGREILFVLISCPFCEARRYAPIDPSVAWITCGNCGQIYYY